MRSSLVLTGPHRDGSTLAIEGIDREFRGFPYQTIEKRTRDAEHGLFLPVFNLLRHNSTKPVIDSPMPSNDRVLAYKFSKVYPLYVQKAENKNRTQEEVDQLLCWLTGYTRAGLQKQIKKDSDLKTFFAEAPLMHPNCSLIKGVVCGIRVEEIKDPLMRKVRYMDKLIDELAKGKALDKIMR